MIVEKGHFHFAEKYWGAQGPPGAPCSDGLGKNKSIKYFFSIKYKGRAGGIEAQIGFSILFPGHFSIASMFAI